MEPLRTIRGKFSYWNSKNQFVKWMRTSFRSQAVVVNNKAMHWTRLPADNNCVASGHLAQHGRTA